MMRLKTAFLTLIGITMLLLLSSWENGNRMVGPTPPAPIYSDSTQWFICDRGAEADLFYIISTETGDHLVQTPVISPTPTTTISVVV